MKRIKSLILRLEMDAVYILRNLFRIPAKILNRHLSNLAEKYVKENPDERNDISMRYW